MEHVTPLKLSGQEPEQTRAPNMMSHENTLRELSEKGNALIKI